VRFCEEIYNGTNTLFYCDFYDILCEQLKKLILYVTVFVARVWGGIKGGLVTEFYFFFVRMCGGNI
jgi:hypothetical protein